MSNGTAEAEEAFRQAIIAANKKPDDPAKWDAYNKARLALKQADAARILDEFLAWGDR